MSYSKAVSVDRSFWKISHHSKLIWLEFAASVDNGDNFHFLFLSRKFSTAAVCIQLSTFPSFALWPSFEKFTGSDRK